jgi:pyrroloquinoline quinone biosynthesis protein D
MRFSHPHRNAVTPDRKIRRPLLAAHARYRWDELRGQHQLVYPEGILILNESGAAIVQLCDGRCIDKLLKALQEKYSEESPAAEVDEFLERLASKGLLHDGSAA